MTQEDRQILLKDLSSRLPYGVCYRHFVWDDERGEECIAAQIYSINSDGYVKNCYDDETVYIDDVRPYLFPLSSMSEEQKIELEQIKNNEDASYCHDINDFFLKYHLDNRHLIEKGLAIDATELNIY